RAVVAGGAALAVAAAGAAVLAWTQARANRLLAAANREVEQQKLGAEAQRDRAQASYRLARAALRDCLNQVVQDPLVRQGELEDLKRKAQRVEYEFYQKFVDLRGDEPEFRAERAAALRSLSTLTARLASPAEAVEVGRRARDEFARL